MNSVVAALFDRFPTVPVSVIVITSGVSAAFSLIVSAGRVIA